MRKFKILKDTPQDKAGDIFEQYCVLKEDNLYAYQNITGKQVTRYSTCNVENNPEWFEEIIEPKFQTDFSKLKDVSGYWITESSNVSKFLEDDFDRMERQVNKLMFSLESLAKSCLALAQLSQFVKEWNSLVEEYDRGFYTIYMYNEKLDVHFILNKSHDRNNYKIKFNSRELAELSLQHHKDLWLDYYQKKQ